MIRCSGEYGSQSGIWSDRKQNNLGITRVMIRCFFMSYIFNFSPERWKFVSVCVSLWTLGSVGLTAKLIWSKQTDSRVFTDFTQTGGSCAFVGTFFLWSSVFWLFGTAGQCVWDWVQINSSVLVHSDGECHFLCGSLMCVALCYRGRNQPPHSHTLLVSGNILGNT